MKLVKLDPLIRIISEKEALCILGKLPFIKKNGGGAGGMYFFFFSLYPLFIEDP